MYSKSTLNMFYEYKHIVFCYSQENVLNIIYGTIGHLIK